MLRYVPVLPPSGNTKNQNTSCAVRRPLVVCRTSIQQQYLLSSPCRVTSCVLCGVCCGVCCVVCTRVLVLLSCVVTTTTLHVVISRRFYAAQPQPAQVGPTYFEPPLLSPHTPQVHTVTSSLQASKHQGIKPQSIKASEHSLQLVVCGY